MSNLASMTKEQLIAHIEATQSSGAEVTITEKGGVHIKHSDLLGVSSKGKKYKQGINLSKTAAKAMFGSDKVFKEIQAKVKVLDLTEDQDLLCEAQKATYEAEQKAKQEQA